MARATHALTPNERLLAALAYLQWWVSILVVLATDADRQPYARYHGLQAVGLGLVIQIAFLLIFLPMSLLGLAGLLIIGLAAGAPYVIVLWFPLFVALAGLTWLPHLVFAYAAYTRNSYFAVPLVCDFMTARGWLVRPDLDPVPVESSDADVEFDLPAERTDEAGTRALAALSYLAWWLALVALLVSREGRRPYANFHAVQGLALEIGLFAMSFMASLLLFPLYFGFILAGSALDESGSSLSDALAALGVLLYVALVLAVSLLPWIYRLYLAGRAVIAADYFSIPIITRFLVNQDLLDFPGTQESA